MLVGVWLIISVILNTSYKGSLKAKLIAPRIKLPFTNFEELLHNKVMKFIVTPGTVFYKAGLVSDLIRPHSCMSFLLHFYHETITIFHFKIISTPL